MRSSSLILIANPGSASRKYALFEGEHEHASLHFEWQNDRIIGTLTQDGKHQPLELQLTDLASTATQLDKIFRDHGIVTNTQPIERIGLRVVAPGSFFLEDRVVDDEFVARLEKAESLAPIHIAATMQELRVLRQEFSGVPVIGISDSAFHITKPDYAWNYGIALEDADQLDIKRFGYHGIAAASVVRQLLNAEKLPAKLIVCHLGSGASVTAIRDGKSVDNTMGYSPLEGLIMGTRSGSIDPTAVRVLKVAKQIDDLAAENYLNHHAGLLGLGGSADIRDLLQREENGDQRAHLALNTFIYSVQKAVGQMAAALGGVDGLVFSGAAGERSPVIRKRVLEDLHYLDFLLDDHANQNCQAPNKLIVISRLAHSKPVFAILANEAQEMAHRAQSVQFTM